jgi:catechol O-methyltransferase
MDLGSNPFFYHHIPKNLLLILLSLLWLPLSLALATVSLICSPRFKAGQPKDPGIDGVHRKTILVTGISMTKGLTIARVLAEHTPHRIIAADREPIPFLSPGRYSRSITKFYPIQTPQNEKKGSYIKSLLWILEQENVNLWISCSSVTDTIEDGEVMRIAQKTMRNGFKAAQFDSHVVAKLHEKDALMDYIHNLGLAFPESHRCTSVGQVEKILHACSNDDVTKDRQKKFILKPIGLDDKARNQMMTLLPFAQDQASRTGTYLRSLNICPGRPFILQQFISGPEYCTHSLVVRGQVKAFVSCPSSDLLMHYQSLPPSSTLNKQMLEFTKRVCENEGKSFSGHLSFDFLVEGEGENATLCPIECNPRAHTAVVLFRSTSEIANAYLSYCDSDSFDKSIITPDQPSDKYYWIGHDLVTLLISPILAVICGQGNIEEAKINLMTFWKHLTCWQEATFVVWDPWPFFVLYHVYWPFRFCECLVMDRQWSRTNVSTTKMFES